MIALTLLAAAVQTVLPQPHNLFIKPPLLTAVAIYYALSRPLPLALTAAAWCGVLTDLLSGLPIPLTALFLLVVGAGLRSWRRFVADWPFGQALIATAFVAILQMILYAVVLGSPQGFAGRFLVLTGGTAAAGAATGVLIFGVCRWLDSWSGNLKGASTQHGVAWHNANI